MYDDVARFVVDSLSSGRATSVDIEFGRDPVPLIDVATVVVSRNNKTYDVYKSRNMDDATFSFDTTGMRYPIQERQVRADLPAFLQQVARGNGKKRSILRLTGMKEDRTGAVTWRAKVEEVNGRAVISMPRERDLRGLTPTDLYR